MSFFINFSWKFDPTILDVFIETDYIVREEGRLSKEKLKYHNSEGEEVTFRSYSVFIQHFRGEVGRTPTKSFSKIILSLFAESKVYEKDMAILSQHDIVRFQVSIDDVQRVNIFNGQNDLSCIQSDFFIRKGHLLIEMFCQVFPFTILEPKVDIVGCLEGEMKVDDERMIDLLQDIDLGDNKLSLFAQNDFFLLKYFQGIKLLVFYTFCKKNFTKGTLPQVLNDIEIDVPERGIFFRNWY